MENNNAKKDDPVSYWTGRIIYLNSQIDGLWDKWHDASDAEDRVRMKSLKRTIDRVEQQVTDAMSQLEAAKNNL